jgi:hypothetical protein
LNQKLLRELLIGFIDQQLHLNLEACLCNDKIEGDQVACEECNRWFHQTCVGLIEEQKNQLSSLYWCCFECNLYLTKRASNLS